MIRVTLAALAMAGLYVHSAAADGGPWVAPEDDSFITGIQDANSTTDSGLPTNTAQGIGTYHQEPACDGICTGNRTCPDGTVKIHSWIELPNGQTAAHSWWCPSEGEAPAVTDDLVAIAFQRVPLPSSTFTIQPPGGRTLVNFLTP